MAPTATVFDLDGTLACLPINWEELFEKLKDIMHVDVIRPLVEVVSRVDEKTRNEVFAAWDIAELAIFEKITTCSEGMKLYQESTSKPKALVTLQGKKVVKIIMERFRLSFDAIVTREDSLSRAEQLTIISERLKISVKEMMFVGNADTDEDAAKKVGCQFYRVKNPDSCDTTIFRVKQSFKVLKNRQIVT
jgi:HAD superfamily hydrolase (TIGR01549 family)